MADVQLTYLQDLPAATLLQLADLFLVHQSGNEKSVSLSALQQVLQPLDATLTALAALTGAADKLPYFSGDDIAALTPLTSVGRDVIGQTSIANLLTYLGIAPDQLCTSWVRFDSTGSTPVINSAFNVTSVTRTATGKHTIKFTNAMSNANYAFNYTVGGDANAIKGGGGDTTLPTTENLYVSSFRGVGTGSGVPLDAYSFPINSVSTYGGK